MPRRREHPDARPIAGIWRQMKPAGRVGAIHKLLTTLDEAAHIYYHEGAITIVDETERNSAPPKLQALTLAGLAFLEFIDVVDRGAEPGIDLRHRIVADLSMALSDLRDGREPPDWFRPYKALRRHGGASLITWYARALAVAALRGLRARGLPPKDAERIVFDVVKDRGLGARAVSTVVAWDQAINPRASAKGRAPDSAIAVYRQDLQRLAEQEPTGVDDAALVDWYRDGLAKQLHYRGFFTQKSTGRSTKRVKAYR